MSDPKDKWTRPLAPPAPMFFGKKERDLVKQINDELAERVLGQTIAYYPISIEESSFNDVYGEAKEKVSLPPIRVYAFVEVENEQTNKTFGYEYQTKLKVYFSERRIAEDQDLYVRVGDFVQYGEFFYEIVRIHDDTRYYFGQVEHKFQIAAECVRARKGTFRVMPGIDRATTATEQAGEQDNPAPRPAPYPPLAASYVTVNPDSKLPNERVLTAGTGITITDGGPNNTITIDAAGANAQGIAGAVQLQHGAGSFAGNNNLVFLTGSARLGIGTDTPTHNLTIDGNMSASSDVLIGGDLTVKGVVVGGSPLKISGGLSIVNQFGTELADITPNDHGSMSISASCLLSYDLDTCYITASAALIPIISSSTHISSSLYYGDGRYLTNITASATQVAEGPVGALQFRIDSPVAGDLSGSSQVLYDISNNRLSFGGGLTFKRTAVSTTHTASVSNYILGITAVPTEILFDATLFSDGQGLVIKDESGAANATNAITLMPSASQTIDGLSTAIIESPYGSVFMYSDGTNWFIY